MNKKRFIKGVFFFTLLAAFLPFSADAADQTDFNFEATQNLYNLCSVKSDDPNFIPAIYACRGFMEAAVQYHDAVTDKKGLKRLICYGTGATIHEGREAFVAWAEKHRDDKKLMEELPVIGLVRALADKYPCSK